MDEYLDFAKGLARDAGDVMREYFKVGVEHTDKSDLSPVTEADLKINKQVVEAISQQYPGHAVVGEEQSKPVDGAEFAWVVDPIDGTIPFMRGVPTNVFSIALVEDGKPALGVVYDPYLDRMYSAVSGKGAYLNDNSIAVSDNQTLTNGYVIADTILFRKNLSAIQSLVGLGVRPLAFGCIVYGNMLVAAGQIDAAIYPQSMPWDCAAAKVIIEEAGGVTSDLRGNQQRYDQPTNGFVASSNQAIHDELLNFLKDTQINA